MTMMTRKRFLGLGVGLVGGGVAGGLGCGDDEEVSESGMPGGTAGNSQGGDGGHATSGGGDGANASGASGGNPSGGGDGGSGGAVGQCGAAITALISQNHSNPHVLTIPLQDVIDAVDREYDTTGPSTHCHTVALTTTDFLALQRGEVVIKHSCSGLTDHEYVLSCEPNPPAGGAPNCGGTPNLGTCP